MNDECTVRSPEQLRELLQACRKQAGMTLTDAALRLDVTRQTLSALERNAENVSAGRLMHLLSIMGVELVLRKTEHHAGSAQQDRHGPSNPSWSAMGRHSRARALSLWMNGVFVGAWRNPQAGDVLEYAPA